MKYIKNFCFILFLIVTAGVIIGRFSGNYILSSAFRGKITILTFIFSPSQSLMDTYSLLNTSSDYQRLSGYYAYKESGLADSEFLYERYKIENSDIIKKTIIWIAENNFRDEKLVDFYRKIYTISPENIQKDLLSKIRK